MNVDPLSILLLLSTMARYSFLIMVRIVSFLILSPYIFFCQGNWLGHAAVWQVSNCWIEEASFF